MKNIFVVMCAVLLIASCNNGQKITEEKTIDLTGKTFESEIKNNMPEGGGSDFVTFKDAKSGDVKTGDIVQPMSYKIEGNKVLVLGTQFNYNNTFEIKDNSTLLDEHGTNWLLKK